MGVYVCVGECVCVCLCVLTFSNICVYLGSKIARGVVNMCGVVWCGKGVWCGVRMRVVW